MGINQVEVDTHWNYFLSLEDDFLHISRYIQFHADNNATYSIEFAKIILASCSEVDVVAKAITKQLGKKTEKINEHMDVLLPTFPDIPQHKVFMDRFGMDVTPWENWGQGKSPDWWKSHTNIKHDRGNHFNEANLQNTFRSIAGLLVLLVYYLRQAGANEVYPPPRVLSTEPAFTSFATDPRKRIFVLNP
jgi:hypothetical protein